MNDEFAAEIESAMRRIGCSNRSQFIRDAIIEKIRTHKIEIDAALAAAPMRVGKKKA